MIAVEADTHKHAKMLAARMGLPLYRVTAIAFNALEIDLLATPHPTGDDHANA